MIWSQRYSQTLNWLIVVLLARYCYIHYFQDGARASQMLSAAFEEASLPLKAQGFTWFSVTLPEVMVDVVGVLYAHMRFAGTTAALDPKPGKLDYSNYGPCAGDDYLFNGSINGQPLWLSSSLGKFIAFNGRVWVCSDVKYMDDVRLGGLKGTRFGGFQSSMDGGVFQKSTWVNYRPRVLPHVRMPILASLNATSSLKPSSTYIGSVVALHLIETHPNTGSCAGDDYLFNGSVNGQPLWQSSRLRRFIAFNGNLWICSDLKYLEDVRLGEINGAFGGLQASNSGPTYFEDSSWEHFRPHLHRVQASLDNTNNAKGAPSSDALNSATLYQGTFLHLNLKPSSQDSSKCAGDDYRVGGQINGQPFWQSQRLKRFIAYNGQHWVCSNIAYLESVKTAAADGIAFGGLIGSTGKEASADKAVEKSVWEDFIVLLTRNR